MSSSSCWQRCCGRDRGASPAACPSSIPAPSLGAGRTQQPPAASCPMKAPIARLGWHLGVAVGHPLSSLSAAPRLHVSHVKLTARCLRVRAVQAPRGCRRRLPWGGWALSWHRGAVPGGKILTERCKQHGAALAVSGAGVGAPQEHRGGGRRGPIARQRCSRSAQLG